MKHLCGLVALIAAVAASGSVAAAQQASGQSATSPTLVRLDGQLKTAAGDARTGSVTLVVSLYAGKDDTTPLWTEQQPVTLDAAGRYTIYAGSTLPDGVPQEFLSGADGGHWLGVGVQGEAEQFRMLLVTVPYALKAREADTLAGKTLSDFVLTESLSDTVKSSLKSQLSGTSGTSGTPGTAAVSTADAFALTGLQAVVNPGMFFGTVANAVIFSGGGGGFQFNNTANSVALMNLTNSGNLGIGTTSPSRPVHLFGASPEMGLESNQGGGRLWTLQSNGTGIFPATFQIIDRTAGASRLAIDNSGNVGMGTPAPSRALHLKGVAPELGIESTQPGGSLWTIQSNGNSVVLSTLQIIDRTAGAARLGIDSSGNVGIGTTSPTQKLDVVGNVNVSGNITGAKVLGAVYSDVAEWVETSTWLEAGTVVIVDPVNPNQVVPSPKAYDTRVAGAVSQQPGVLLGVASDSKAMVAQSGRVRIKVDARYGAIKIGDLLVTSPTPGYAMVSKPVKVGRQTMHLPGTLLGKALEALPNGQGEILALLTLQ